MKLKLGRKPEGPPRDHTLPAVRTRRLTDRSEILSHIEPRRLYAAAAFAHLDRSFPEVSHWHLATLGDRSALCLVSRGMNPSYVFTMGDPLLLGSLLPSVHLPGRACITCQPDHLPIIEEHYELEWHLLAKRMAVSRETFTPDPGVATRLKPAHVGEVNRLYEFEHTGNFTASHLRRGVFYGVWQEEQLVAVAGTHSVTPVYGIAYVGNVLTHPRYRNQGLARICASSVTAELLDTCAEVVLNVEAHNMPAIRAYENLGYADHCRIVEAIGHRKSLVGVIITSVCKRLGLVPKYREGMEPDGQLPSEGRLSGRLGTQGDRSSRT